MGAERTTTKHDAGHASPRCKKEKCTQGRHDRAREKKSQKGTKKDSSVKQSFLDRKKETPKEAVIAQRK